MDTQKDKSPETNPFRMLKQKQQSTTNDSNTQSQNAPPTLAQLETEIKFHLNQASQSIIEVGKRLIQAKSLVKHGEWQTWLENNFQLSYRTAKNFMDCAERFPNLQTSADLNQSQMTEMLVLPSAEDTKKFIEQKAAEGTPVSDMTAKTLRKEVKKWKAETIDAKKAKIVDEQIDAQKQQPTDMEKPLQPDSQTKSASSTDSESLEQNPLAEEQSLSESKEQNKHLHSQKAEELLNFNESNWNSNTDTVTVRAAMSSIPDPLDILFLTSNELVTLPDLKEQIIQYASDVPETFLPSIESLFKIVDIIREISNRK